MNDRILLARPTLLQFSVKKKEEKVTMYKAIYLCCIEDDGDDQIEREERMTLTFLLITITTLIATFLFLFLFFFIYN
jgi:hypothetical protein